MNNTDNDLSGAIAQGSQGRQIIIEGLEDEELPQAFQPRSGREGSGNR